MNALNVVIGCIVVVGALVSAAIMLPSMILAARSRAPGAPRPGPYEGPFGILYRPDVLTPEGRRHRRRCLIAVAGFLVCGLVGALAVLAGVLAKM